jgi:hypothetical protein
VDERWEKALAWHEALPMGRRKVEYNATIRRALAQLQQVTSLQDLQTTYDAGLEWVVDLAREGFPDTPALWATERTADVAFGLRARQLLGVPPGP